MMTTITTRPAIKRDADYIFHELTRSICPECKAVIDAQIIIRSGKVYMRKRCPVHGWFEGIISSDAEMYVGSVRFNKPGTLPLDFSTEVNNGCPLDCGLCPEHKQHICLALIEVNTACNLNCPVCFANAGIGYSLTLEQVETMLDRFVETEGNPEVVQFSGSEPTIPPAAGDDPGGRGKLALAQLPAPPPIPNSPPIGPALRPVCWNELTDWYGKGKSAIGCTPPANPTRPHHQIPNPHPLHPLYPSHNPLARNPDFAPDTPTP